MNTSARIVQNRWQWWIPLAAILICLGTVQSVFSLLAFAICAVVIVAAPNQASLYMMVFLLPFSNIFKISPDAQSFFTYLLLLYVLRWIIVKQKITKRFAILWVMLIVYTACQMLSSYNILRMVKFFANFLFVYCALEEENHEYYKNVFLFYILGVVCSSAIVSLGVLPDVHSYIGEKDMFISDVNQSRFAGMYADPNYYAVNVIISLCLVVLLHHCRAMKILPALALSAALVFFAVITYSRSAFIMLLLPLVLLLYSKIKKRRYFTLAVVIVAAVVVMASALAGRIAFLEVMLSRFEDTENVNDFTTGRTEIWADYMQYLGQNPVTLFLGEGLGAALVKGKAAHNTYIDVLYHLGFVGGGLFMGLLMTLFGSVNNSNKKNLLNYGVLFAILSMYFFLSELFYFDLAFHILVAIMCVKMPLRSVRTEAVKYEKGNNNMTNSL